jgi:hypothetical protein
MQQRVKPGFILRVSKIFSRRARRFSVPSSLSICEPKWWRWPEARGAGFYHLAGDNVSINNVNPELGKCVGHGTFTAANAAC